MATDSTVMDAELGADEVEEIREYQEDELHRASQLRSSGLWINYLEIEERVTSQGKIKGSVTMKLASLYELSGQAGGYVLAYFPDECDSRRTLRQVPKGSKPFSSPIAIVRSKPDDFEEGDGVTFWLSPNDSSELRGVILGSISLAGTYERYDVPTEVSILAPGSRLEHAPSLVAVTEASQLWDVQRYKGAHLLGQRKTLRSAWTPNYLVPGAGQIVIPRRPEKEFKSLLSKAVERNGVLPLF